MFIIHILDPRFNSMDCTLSFPSSNLEILSDNDLDHISAIPDWPHGTCELVMGSLES